MATVVTDALAQHSPRIFSIVISEIKAETSLPVSHLCNQVLTAFPTILI